MQADPQQPPPSFEGGERRCFRDMYVCGKRFKAANQLERPVGPSPEEQAAALRKSIPREDFTFGQALVRHVQQRQQRQQQQQQQQQLGHPSRVQVEISSSGAGSSTSSGGGWRLKILLIRRGGVERQILNVQELLQRCNTWRHQPPNSSTPVVTAECREVRLVPC